MHNIEFYEVKDANRTLISFVFDIEFFKKLNLNELKEHYRHGGLGDVKIKKFLNDIIQ